MQAPAPADDILSRIIKFKKGKKPSKVKREEAEDKRRAAIIDEMLEEAITNKP